MARGEAEDAECDFCGTTLTEQLHAFCDYTVIVEAICETVDSIALADFLLMNAAPKSRRRRREVLPAFA
jgi:hypothetical protein